jgi:hypothetical protein
MFKSLKESLETYGVENKLTSELSLRKIEEAWKKTVGTQIEKNTKLSFVKNNTLFVKTNTPVWRNELEFRKTEILEKLLDELSNTRLTNIRFI